jgi:glucosamine--fructose-6-phosphate aminotransferase (isomerizing)
MCGIFGIVTATEQQLGPILIQAGKRLAYRGYDSVGCATLHADGAIDLRKDVGKVDQVAERLHFAEMRGRRGITQLRWATFGAPSQVNAQPHLDSDGRMVGAHNGNVVNNVELREAFIAEGITVRSTNDGESCVHAVERYVRRGADMVTAIRRAYDDLQGDYAFVIGAAADEKLYAFKKGSGLVVGLADGATCCSSDLPSILPLTRRILRVQDGEIVILSAEAAELRRVSDGGVVEREPEIVTEEMETVEKGGYAHFMLKEIHEQPQVAKDLLHLLGASPHVAPMVEAMRRARQLYLVACGTSYHACLVGAVYLNRLAGRSAMPILAPQFIAQYGDAIGPQDVGVFVSQSGETKDVLNAVEVAQAREMQVLALANVIGSTLMNVSARYLPLACGYEISVPATKTFLNQVVAFLVLALRMGGRSTAHLSGLPALLERTLTQVEPHVKRVLPYLEGRNDLYCLGYGLTYGIALEGALKLKEITYAHCEGMLSTEFKHGPLSAVHDGYPVIFVAGPEDVPLLVSAVNEVTCRGGRAIAVAEENEQLRRNVHDYLVLPRSDPFIQPLLATLPLQLLSYEMSVARGFDPDFPRNLSKTLTVD